MAFIDDFNKLVVKNGQQQKIANKDKAIIDLANEVANGGGGQTKRIVACWKEISENEFEEIDKEEEDGEETFNIDSFTDINKRFLFTTDTNEPNGQFENVALVVIPQNPNNISIKNLRAITEIYSRSDTDIDNNSVIPYTEIIVFDDTMSEEVYLSIVIKDSRAK